MKITLEWMDANRTAAGSWTMAQVVSLGVKWPPTNGWRNLLVGKEITETTRMEFEAFATVFAADRKRAKRAAVAPIAPTNPKSIRRAAKKLKRKEARFAAASVIHERKAAAAASPVRVIRPSAPKTTRFRIDPNSPDFLLSYEWRAIRMRVLTKYGRVCMCCGATPESGAVMHVDHIKPRRLFPMLALDFENLQVLCHECNHGKGNWDQTDWRPEENESINQEVRAMIRGFAKGE